MRSRRGNTKSKPIDLSHRILFETYFAAKDWIENSIFAEELNWQSTQSPSSITESHFLREAAWVILCSGFRERVVRAHFDYISLCFFDWESASAIAANRELCIYAAKKAFNSIRKLTAIARVAHMVRDRTFEVLKQDLMDDPLECLSSFPYIGKVTVFHLAKNLGFDVCKPDRHLVRLSNAFGTDVESMCRMISYQTGDPIAHVDLILWRYLEAADPDRRDKLLSGA